jgi:hypothetical protein
VAEPGTVHGDHRLPSERWRQRCDRRLYDGDVIGGGVAARRAFAQHPGQRLPVGDIAITQQRVVSKDLEPARRAGHRGIGAHSDRCG